MKIIFWISFLVALTLEMVHGQDNSALLKVGTQAPAFTLTSVEGKTVSLSDFKGRYVLIDFWASWCHDCRKASPEMVALFAKYGKENITFLGVSFDDKRENWENAVKHDQLTWTHVSELKKWKETTISGQYGIRWIPTVYLIDPDGRVAYADINGRGLEEKLQEIFGRR
ncbi:peroxiredoxin family protein [Tannerella forsythia]